MQETLSVVEGESIEHQPARALLAWLSEEEAVQLLLGREPTPADDLERHRAAFAQRRRVLDARPAFVQADAVVTDHDWDLGTLAQDPQLPTAFSGLDWTLAVVDLRQVVAYQKAIRVGGLEERLAPVLEGDISVAEFCVPPGQSTAPTGAVADVDNRGYTCASANPNLRLAGSQLQPTTVPTAAGPSVRMLSVTFFVSVGTSYVQVARYRDRVILRDGYHRAAGLLRAGIHHAPCVLITARTFEEVGANPTKMLSYEVLFGDCPPRLVDFWDDAVAAEISVPTMRRVVRIRAEEFNIHG